MQPVYFAHGYREREAPFAEYFGNMLRHQRLVPSIDPPSEAVNAAKLERHLRQTKGFVAVVADRGGTISPHIMFEISVAMRSGKPTAVFFEDSLSPNLFPSGVIKRRFSARSFIRETREHLHALELLETYIGRENLPRFVSEADHRTCLLIGVRNSKVTYKDEIIELIETRGFSHREITSGRLKLPIDARFLSEIRSADIVVSFLDDASPASMYCLGLARASMVPALLYATSINYPLATGVPRDYQRVFLPACKPEQGIRKIQKDFDLFEEDFIELGNESEAQIYANELASIASVSGEYSADVRRTIIKEIRMGDIYNNSGQAGAVGPKSTASGNTFVQMWNEKSDSIDLQVLATELDTLRQALKKISATPEQDASLGAVAAAQTAAQNGDGPETISYLSKAGKWALDVGTKVGAGVAVAAIKSSMGF